MVLRVNLDLYQYNSPNRQPMKFASELWGHKPHLLKPGVADERRARRGSLGIDKRDTISPTCRAKSSSESHAHIYIYIYTVGE
jgi:hypothetical protein